MLIARYCVEDDDERETINLNLNLEGTVERVKSILKNLIGSYELQTE